MLKARTYELGIAKGEQAAMDDNATKSDIGWGSQIRILCIASLSDG